MSDSDAPWGWQGPISTFLSIDNLEVYKAIRDHHNSRFPDFEAGHAQRSAWIQTIESFQRALRDQSVVDIDNQVRIVFEYELPGEGGRRPDVLFLFPTGDIFVIECKNRTRSEPADRDQVRSYMRSLSQFHSETHNKQVHPFVALVDPGATQEDTIQGIPITASGSQFDKLTSALETTLASNEFDPTWDPDQWLTGEYQPLPSLTNAVVRTYQRASLPEIKSSHRSSKAPDAVEQIHTLMERAKKSNRHTLILVTGIPGSGKTMVGLQSTIQASDNGVSALYLSGNGPLVDVLQDALVRSGASEGAARSIIRGMYQFRRDVSGNAKATPAQMYVFDEGQRAWDESKSNHQGSEIELLLQAAERTEWGVVVGLIGEGQAIHEGEQGDLGTWISEAAARKRDWDIVTPNTVQEPQITERYEALHLDINIRAQTAELLQDWVEAVLEERPSDAASVANQILDSGYQLYLTESRSTAEDYVNTYFENDHDSRYGWIVSSQHSPKDSQTGLSSDFVPPKKRRDVWGTWFNSPPGEDGSCCQLNRACDEFGCQGLELDFSLMCWGNDFKRRETDWVVPSNIRKWADDRIIPTKNVYRVLLTRGRQGLIIWSPDDQTRSYLSDCGMRGL